MPESVTSLMKENQALEIQIDSLSDTGYSFEYVPTPLAAGGVGMYVKDCLKCTAMERTSEDAFQALSSSDTQGQLVGSIKCSW